ncbi:MULTISPECIES: glycosyltransferase family 2 protein [unclassified Dehalobacter]|uniref:glycosyltransferase family 2 protein n=1 Tax=unclassified Dehalobacter TaxID=2635733 RepID=UPI00036BB1AE|nr:MULTISPECIES: glycosyltransferase family 2 protein [unclassified Dehalobacter]RJE47729.1 glycosyl transferase family 2 [Dehalobacter sp. MCB1]TCX53774.1 glycosyltransferase family 2 protein [Dehalobacter sp. 14DCB1]TCX55077.1 glycosyltransferase family 2 protein [Dehalobacter sp. 12DCB1]
MKVLIGLPAYNEATGIIHLFNSIASYREVSRYNIQVLLVDDGSIDDTAEIVSTYARDHGYVTLVRHHGNKGLGEAVKTILRHALETLKDDDVLVTMDADNTHSPLLIESMIETLNSRDLDLVVASRFTSGGYEIGLKTLRKFFSRGARCFFKLFFRIKNLNDYSSGYRAYRVRVIRKAQDRWKELITTNGFDCMAEIVAKFSRMEVKAGEVPLILHYQQKEGASKMQVSKTVRGYFALLAKVR